MTLPKFIKSRNRDCSIDSICTSCFQTIASAACEEQLALHGQEHTWDPYWHFSFTSIVIGALTRPGPTRQRLSKLISDRGDVLQCEPARETHDGCARKFAGQTTIPRRLHHSH